MRLDCWSTIWILQLINEVAIENGPSREEVTGGWRERHNEERSCAVNRKL
jgi:hypothetical protein